MDAFPQWLPCIAGFVIAAVSAPMALGRVKPNHWYGARVPVAFRSDEDWYAINRDVGRVGVIAGLVAAIACAGLAAMPGPEELRMGIGGAVLVLAALAMGVATFIAARRRKALDPPRAAPREG